MTSTEEKLARELGFRINEEGSFEFPVYDENEQPDGFTLGFEAPELVIRIWRKCLELTELREVAQSLISELDALEKTGGLCIPSLGVMNRLQKAVSPERHS